MAKLSEEVRGGTHGWAFGASLRDPADVGYTEREFFLAGDAKRYTLAEGSEYSFDGGWVARERDTSPFRTRLLVRRPADSARFNGTVIVNWNNVSIGHESLPGMSAELLEAGFAWVGASVQRVSVHVRQAARSCGLGSQTLRHPVDPRRRPVLRHLHAGCGRGGTRAPA